MGFCFCESGRQCHALSAPAGMACALGEFIRGSSRGIAGSVAGAVFFPALSAVISVA